LNYITCVYPRTSFHTWFGLGDNTCKHYVHCVNFVFFRTLSASGVLPQKAEFLSNYNQKFSFRSRFELELYYLCVSQNFIPYVVWAGRHNLQTICTLSTFSIFRNSSASGVSPQKAEFFRYEYL
jgi:hypothetical protein